LGESLGAARWLQYEDVIHINGVRLSHESEHVMRMYEKLAVAACAAVAIVAGAAGVGLADEPARHVVGESEIQTRIDQQVDRADADREAVQTLLQREDVRRIAGSAGLDLQRASAVAAVLSGPELENFASLARDIDAGLAGGDSTVVISATTLIIILLIILLLR
jgi:cell division protein FtsL